MSRSYEEFGDNSFAVGISGAIQEWMHSDEKEKNSNNWRKCNGCGKYLSIKSIVEQEDVVHVFIPDTEFTKEESYFIHKKCQS